MERVRQLVGRFGDESNSNKVARHFALFDAQSVIAHNYGFPSWRELRVAVDRGGSEATIIEPDEDPELTLDESLTSVIRRVAMNIARHDWTLEACLEYVYSALAEPFQFQRLGFATIEHDGTRALNRWVRSDRPIRLGHGFAAGISRSSLAMVMASGDPRIIENLPAYLRDHPQSVGTAAIVAEGFRSSLTCPIFVHGGASGFAFFNSDKEHAFSNSHAQFMQSVLAPQLSIVLERESSRNSTMLPPAKDISQFLPAQLKRAQLIQQEMMGLNSTEIAGLDIAFAYEPASHVSGDILDIIELGDHAIMMLIGDTMGHGVDAAMVTSAIKGSVRQLIKTVRDPASVLTHLNCFLAEWSNTTFATAVCVLLNTIENWLEIAMAGHYPPMILDAKSAAVIEPDAGAAGLPLGVDHAECYDALRYEFAPGDVLTLFTDGIVEGLNAGGRMYGRESIRRVIRKSADSHPGKLLAMIRDDMNSHCGAQSLQDDLTLLVVRRSL